MGRRKWVWTAHQLDKLNEVKKVIVDLKDYVPLTIRQIFYQLVGTAFIENTTSQYVMLDLMMKWARIDGHISWKDIEDRGRIYHNLVGWRSVGNFIQSEVKGFLEGYQRNLMQTQDKYIEVWIEKDALSSIATKIARKYGVSVVVDRGFSSVDFLHDYQLRIKGHSDQYPVMLYFGDYDPSGQGMLPAMQTTLEDEMGVKGIEFKPIALTKKDIIEYKLPHNPKAIKKEDSRTAKFIEKYGEYAVELDALPVKVLEKKIQDAIEAEIDIDLFNIEVKRHNERFDMLNILKSKAVNAFNEILSNKRG